LFMVSVAQPTHYDVAQRVALAGKISFFAKQSPPGFVGCAPRGSSCCGFFGADTVAVTRTWTPNGCSGKCNETARCAAFSFEPKDTLCVLCTRCNATSTTKEWRSFARLGTAAAYIALSQSESTAAFIEEEAGHGGLVSSLLSAREAVRWEQLPPRSGRLGAGECDATRKGRRSRSISCDNPHKQERCRTLVAQHGRAAACRKSCFCSRCSQACALQALQWRSPYGLIEARSTLTQPRFTFAYSPNDIDTASMVPEGLVEPAISRAWHAATHECCSRGGRILDVCVRRRARPRHIGSLRRLLSA